MSCLFWLFCEDADFASIKHKSWNKYDVGYVSNVDKTIA